MSSPFWEYCPKCDRFHGAGDCAEHRASLERQWRNANERVNRWLLAGGNDARKICGGEDERMQRIEKELGYVPKPAPKGEA